MSSFGISGITNQDYMGLSPVDLNEAAPLELSTSSELTEPMISLSTKFTSSSLIFV
jgi:hypothetical protein